MTAWAVLATGPSMSPELAGRIRGRCPAVAVSDAYRLAPWAEALASNDSAWWRAHPEALEFAGRKFCAVKFNGTELFPAEHPYPQACNSGLVGMRVAKMLGATRILLFGFDMKGDHYFGKHPLPLRNTTPERFRGFMRQFDNWDGCPVVNCTPGSALKRFPFGSLEDAIGGAT